MPEYKVVDISQLESNLTSIGDAIREKTGDNDMLTFPDGMISAIAGITSGSSGAFTGEQGLYVPATDLYQPSIEVNLPNEPLIFIIEAVDESELPPSVNSSNLTTIWFIAMPMLAGVDGNGIPCMCLNFTSTQARATSNGQLTRDEKQNIFSPTLVKLAVVGSNVWRRLRAGCTYRWTAICRGADA